MARWLLALSLLLPAPLWAQGASVSVAYPLEGHSMPWTPATFILGVTTPAAGTLLLNGTTVPQHTNGGFLAFVPIDQGTFTFHFEFRSGTMTALLDRSILVGKRLEPMPADELALDPDSLSPSEDLGLQAGEWVPLACRGTPGREAEFRIEGVTGWLPMQERPATPGFYEAAWLVTAETEAEAARVRYRVSKGWWSAKAYAAGRVTAPAPFRVVEVSTEPMPVRGGANRGYVLFPQMGTRFVSDARVGSQVRLQLAPGEYGWAGASGLRWLPEGTPPPESVLGTVQTVAGARETSIGMGTTERVPFQVETEGDWVRVRLYNTVGHVNWVVYDSSDTFVREVRWRQESARSVLVSVRLAPEPRLWGYRVEQEPGKLTLVLRRPPAPAALEAKPMAGLTVVVDPGHSPGKEEGAVGPTGRREAEANMAIALELKRMLEEKGASVILTREGDAVVDLADRPRLAWERRGDLFVSVHNNALPDGTNPFATPRGFMVFYYHPHAMDLARHLHAAYRRLSPLADEGLRFGNLLVARETGMPAILTESDYMMFPEREERLFTPEYQKLLARIHLDGIQAFLDSALRPPARKADGGR